MKLFVIGGAPSTHPVIGRTLFEATLMYIHKYFYTKERFVRVVNNDAREEVVVYIYSPDGKEHYRCILEYCDQDVDWAVEVRPNRVSPLPKVVQDIRALFKEHPNTIRVFVDKYKCQNDFNVDGYRIKIQVTSWSGYLPVRHQLSRMGFRMVSDDIDGPVPKKYYLIERA